MHMCLWGVCVTESLIGVHLCAWCTLLLSNGPVRYEAVPHSCKTSQAGWDWAFGIDLRQCALMGTL